MASRRLARDARCRSRSSARWSSISRRLRARWSLQSRLARHFGPQTCCLDLACGLGVNMQRHSEQRLRFGIEHSVDKLSAMAEFSASLATNRVAHGAAQADCGEVIYEMVTGGWIRNAPRVVRSRTAPWIRKVPLGGSEEGCR